MSEPVLLVEKKDGIATLTLNRPKAMNALSRELVSLHWPDLHRSQGGQGDRGRHPHRGGPCLLCRARPERAVGAGRGGKGNGGVGHFRYDRYHT